MAGLVCSGFALVYSYTTAFIATFALSIMLVLVQATVEDRKTWLTWLPIGVLLASVVSGIFGVGAMAAFGMIPIAIFQPVFFGWVFGDIIVLATLGTVFTVVLNPFIVRSKIYVHRFSHRWASLKRCRCPPLNK
jgi:Zn-dependent protease with chaperone function